MSKSDDYLWDRSGAPDPEIARLEGLLAPLGHRSDESGPDELRVRRRRRTPWLIGGALIAAAAIFAVIWQWPARESPIPTSTT
nr:hypothetical protein [Deltaproteobacteria bacterium]